MANKKPLDPDWKKELALELYRLGIIPEGYGGKIEINMNGGGVTTATFPVTLK